MARVPRFPLVDDVPGWDDLTLLAATTLLEAEGEPELGILGVPRVVVNRALAWGITVRQAVLGPDGQAYADGRAFEPFSCWNDDYAKRAAARLAAADGAPLEAAWRAAAAALWQLVPDPTNAATHYLNVELTRKIRGGTLPTWAADPADPTEVNAALVRAVHGRHTFLLA